MGFNAVQFSIFFALLILLVNITLEMCEEVQLQINVGTRVGITKDFPNHIS